MHHDLYTLLQTMFSNLLWFKSTQWHLTNTIKLLIIYRWLCFKISLQPNKKFVENSIVTYYESGNRDFLFTVFIATNLGHKCICFLIMWSSKMWRLLQFSEVGSI